MNSLAKEDLEKRAYKELKKLHIMLFLIKLKDYKSANKLGQFLNISFLNDKNDPKLYDKQYFSMFYNYANAGDFGFYTSDLIILEGGMCFVKNSFNNLNSDPIPLVESNFDDTTHRIIKEKKLRTLFYPRFIDHEHSYSKEVWCCSITNLNNSKIVSNSNKAAHLISKKLLYERNIKWKKKIVSLKKAIRYFEDKHGICGDYFYNPVELKSISLNEGKSEEFKELHNVNGFYELKTNPYDQVLIFIVIKSLIDYNYFDLAHEIFEMHIRDHFGGFSLDKVGTFFRDKEHLKDELIGYIKEELTKYHEYKISHSRLNNFHPNFGSSCGCGESPCICPDPNYC